MVLRMGLATDQFMAQTTQLQSGRLEPREASEISLGNPNLRLARHTAPQSSCVQAALFGSAKT